MRHLSVVCGLFLAACVEQGAETSSAGQPSLVLDNTNCSIDPCPNLYVRVLKYCDGCDPLLVNTVTALDACSISGTGVLVGNMGTATAASSTVKVARSGGATSYYFVPSLAPRTWYEIPTSVTPGTTVTADAYNAVVETDEANTYWYFCP